MASIEAIAAAWGTWKKRPGWKLGPGPGFVEAIDAAIAIEMAAARDAIEFVREYSMRDPVFAKGHDKERIKRAIAIIERIKT